jgi:hypothetical protein
VAKTSVWWGAVVRNFVNPARLAAPRTATIWYDAMHGYEEAECNAVFISASVLEAVERGVNACASFLALGCIYESRPRERTQR